MTRTHNIGMVVPEISDTVCIIEGNDSGGFPVILLEDEETLDLKVFNWLTQMYETVEVLEA